MKNLFTIFTSPRETFERTRENKLAWILPTILALILGVVTIALQMPYLIELSRQTMLKTGGLTPEQVEQAVGLTSTMSYATIIAGTLFMIFFVALLLILLNLIVRGEGKYLQFVNVAAYANLPSIIGALLTIALVVVMDARSLTDVTISLGALVQDKTGMMFRVLSLINPFTIWGLYLYIVGTATMMKRPVKKVAVWIVAVWLIYSFITVLSVPAI
ncbi:YIP1 family protein [Paenibacillus bouchesdurhonensis]|uniref:YIP1 family protein n=1 Tax=Paenibacillus bouchesdurhonensis TaxID=1870990 RepID=UPI000DA60FEC|nr:YIP1 family protein [Paenibacillus bouchesdurhonensis]